MTRKEIALAFMNMNAAGKIDEAFKTFIGPNCRHHNVGSGPTMKDFQSMAEQNRQKFPRQTFQVKHVLEDGDLVFVHAHFELQPPEPGNVGGYLFKIQDGKIVEFWDVGMPIPKDSPNTNGAF